MHTPASFSGFPAEGLHFLRELRENNTKEWFEANKTTFTEALQAPAVALVVALGEGLRAHFPEMRYDTRVNGSGSLMRIYRDTRFSPDKSPYKTNVAMMFTAAAGKRMEQPGFGLQITPEAVEMIAGVFQFPKPMLEAYRSAILIERRAKALDAAAEQVLSEPGYTLGGRTLKRVPSGFDAQYPHAEWLKFTGLHAFSPPLSLDVARTADLVEAALSHFVQMAPIQQWVAQHVYLTD